MNITIRRCMISDSADIRAISKAALGFEFPEEAFEANIRRLMATPGNVIYVAENNGRFMGFAHACDFDILYGPRLKVLRAIAVLEEYRRYGAARQLLEAVEAWAKRHGAEGIRIYAGSERTDAHAFYKTCGYGFVKPETLYKKDF